MQLYIFNVPNPPPDQGGCEYDLQGTLSSGA